MFTKLFKISLIISIIFIQFSLVEADKIQLCSCSAAEQCATKATNHLNGTCKEECAHLLNEYKENGKTNLTDLTNCFWKEEKDKESGALKRGVKLTKCLNKRIPNYCSNNETLFLPSSPDYNKWLEQLTGNSSIEHLPHQGSFIRRARAAFLIFRNFQKCMNNCAKRHSIECFKKGECAISLPLDNSNALKIYNECTKQNANRDAHDSCRCLIKNYRARQLIGICPLMANAHLMRNMP
uniref:Uncharacterized protein n=1 Tax=Meloidogyne enterolobii TaxID=390850 RepID=A0A6V7UUF0_MELEN|nr:unnamed protein product [Meloidogyne enterolobii]